MNQTNRIPGGFLDLLGAETGGKTPPFYDNKISPTLESAELYLAQTLSTYVVNIASTASFAEDRFLVPNNEYWLLRSFAARSNAMASSAYVEGWTLELQEVPRGNSGPVTNSSAPIAYLNLTSGGTGVVRADAVTFPAPILLTPGVEVIIRVPVRDGNATSRTTQCSIVFNKLRAGS